MGFGKMLELKLKEKNVKQSELAKKTGIPKTTLSGMISRDISKVEIENFLKICNALDCDPEEFYDECSKKVEKPLPPSFVKKYNRLDGHGRKTVNAVLDCEYDRITAAETAPEPAPVIEIYYSEIPASAGTGEWLDNERLRKIFIPDTPEARKADIVIPVSGDSMEPTFSDGDWALVQKCDELQEGDIGVFMLDGNGYIKEYAADRLISHNPKYNDIIPGEESECRCVGRVIGKV